MPFMRVAASWSALLSAEESVTLMLSMNFIDSMIRSPIRLDCSTLAAVCAATSERLAAVSDSVLWLVVWAHLVEGHLF